MLVLCHYGMMANTGDRGSAIPSPRTPFTAGSSQRMVTPSRVSLVPRGPAELLGSSLRRRLLPSPRLCSSGHSSSHSGSRGGCFPVPRLRYVLTFVFRVHGAAKDAFQFSKEKHVEPVERYVCFWECSNWYAVGTDRLGIPQSVHRVRSIEGGQGDGSHTACCKLFTSGVRTFPEKERGGRSWLKGPGTLLVSWVRQPHLLGTDTSLGRC